MSLTECGSFTGANPMAFTADVGESMWIPSQPAAKIPKRDLICAAIVIGAALGWEAWELAKSKQEMRESTRVASDKFARLEQQIESNRAEFESERANFRLALSNLLDAYTKLGSDLVEQTRITRAEEGKIAKNTGEGLSKISEEVSKLVSDVQLREERFLSSIKSRLAR
jgi:hypothetical protein